MAKCDPRHRRDIDLAIAAGGGPVPIGTLSDFTQVDDADRTATDKRRHTGWFTS